MNAVTNSKVDVGTPREFDTCITWSVGDSDDICETPIRVRYRVDFPSVWHRGHGREPSLHLLSVQWERNHVFVDAHLPAAVEKRIYELVEAREELQSMDD